MEMHGFSEMNSSDGICLFMVLTTGLCSLALQQEDNKAITRIGGATSTINMFRLIALTFSSSFWEIKCFGFHSLVELEVHSLL